MDMLNEAAEDCPKVACKILLKSGYYSLDRPIACSAYACEIVGVGASTIVHFEYYDRIPMPLIRGAQPTLPIPKELQ